MGVSVPKRRIVALGAAVVAVLGITLLGMAPAQAGTNVAMAARSAATSVTPDFTCHTKSVCVFDGPNGTGVHGTFPTSDSEHWINMTQKTAITLPWASFHDNSGSSVVFGDKQTGAKQCFLPGSKFNVTNFVGRDRYIWIEFGNTDCTGHVDPL
jgi:hypothetical protein